MGVGNIFVIVCGWVWHHLDRAVILDVCMWRPVGVGVEILAAPPNCSHPAHTNPK